MTILFRIAAPFAMAAFMTIPLTAQEPKVGPGTEREGPPVTLMGTLVDAGCRDRGALNLGQAAETYASQKPAETPAEQQAGTAMRAQQGYANPGAAPNNATTTASGVTVDSKTLTLERPDVLHHQVADLRSRQLDPTCAISGATHNFALYMTDGKFLSLDEGGNTYANEAILGSAAGRDMLAGNGGGMKPQVVIKGNIRAEKILVQSIKIK
jgi:hypothetical protein